MAGGIRTLAAAALLLAGPGTAQGAWAQACDDARLDIRGDWGTARFGIEIADEPAEQARGLMFRESLAASAGMLFVYPRAGSPTFWMKNTLIPLDMVFIRADGTVAYVHERAVPGDLTGINGGTGILAVLEIRGGLAEALGIEPGDAVRHPVFDGTEAAWACDTAADGT
ncbi:MAG: DUF192 domain-containing protein [Maritimibacter sp.]|nr:DUF192 domain-containing protein [Maritimibacter sp.]